MNKKLMTMAVIGAIGAPGLAVAQSANVNVYGVLDGRYDSMKFSANATNTISGLTKNHVEFQAPRWGLRGTEDLGGGMAAYFQLESGVSPDGRPDTSASSGGSYSLGGRDSFLGIRSSWGSIQGGGFGTPFKGIQNVWNANPSMNHGGIIMGNGDTTGIMPSPNCQGAPAAGVVPGILTPICGSQAEANQLSYSRRQANFVQYETPNMSGFVGKIGTAASEFAEPSTTTAANAPGLSQNKPKLWSYSLTWSGGPWTAGGAYETHTGFRATNTALTNRMAKDSAWTIGGKWNYGAGDLGVGWESMDYGNAATDAASNAFKQKFWVINGNWKVTQAGTLSAGYSKTPGAKSCGSGLTDAAGTCGTATGATHLHLGYDHALSKRTSVYALYSKITNNNNGVSGAAYYYPAGAISNSAGGTAAGVPAGTDVTLLGVGVKHSF